MLVVPKTWYVGSTTKPSTYVPPGNKLSVGEYVNRWVAEYGRQGGEADVKWSPVDAVTGAVGDAASAAGNIVTEALGDLTAPFLKGLQRISIIGLAVTMGIALVVAGAWRGVKSGG